MIRIVIGNQIVMPALPKWSGGSSLCTYDEVVRLVRRWSPAATVHGPSDMLYMGVTYRDLEAAVKWTLDSLDAQGVRYSLNKFDCENFQRELCQTLAKMAARDPNLTGAPLTGGLSVFQQNAWAGVPVGGFHRVAVALTMDQGLVVIEPQQRRDNMVSLDEYPNRTHILLLSDI